MPSNTKTKVKEFVEPRTMIKRIRRVWIEESQNNVSFTHFHKNKSIRISVARAVTAWFSDHSDVNNMRTRKISLRAAVKKVQEWPLEGFMVYCNGHPLDNCNPLDVIYYVAVVERNMSKARKAPWSLVLTRRELQESTNRVMRLIQESDAADVAEDAKLKGVREKELASESKIAIPDRTRARKIMLAPPPSEDDEEGDEDGAGTGKGGGENGKKKKTQEEQGSAAQEGTETPGSARQEPQGTSPAEEETHQAVGVAPRGKTLKHGDLNDILDLLESGD